MFTGIVESTGTVTEVWLQGTNKTFWIESPLSPAFTVDQSVAHNGTCLTVEEVSGARHRVTAVAETLVKTTLGNWKVGHAVNLEQCLKPNDRLDGHFVQGHVDGMGICKAVENKTGSYQLRFSFPKEFAPLVIEKGSISLNGISLTVFDVTTDGFTVAVIPYTWEHTTLQYLREGDAVNLEFDMIGKYILRMSQTQTR